MIVAIDVHYKADYAKAVSIVFDDWKNEAIMGMHIVHLDEVAPYEPGQFYKRELPCLLEVLKSSEGTKIDCIIVDGYVVLDNAGKLGLGGYLYEALDEKIPVIGVAKKHFHSNGDIVQEVCRGASSKPLYISAAGMLPEIAASYILNMKGNYRMPDLLRMLDQETKRD